MIFDQQYFQLCSEKTLQTNKEGFFLQFAEAVAESVGEKWIKTFAKLKTDKERIRRIYEDDKVKPYVVEFLTNVQEIFRKKCPQTAKKRFLEAKATLKTGDKRKALSLFSQCILKAPNADPTVSLALLSRAKLLTSLNEYSLALTDLQLSLKEKVPNNLKFEIFWTMAICYKALNDENKSKISLNVAEKLTTDPQLLSLLRQSMQIKYQPIKKPKPILPPISGERHAHLPHASKKLTVKNSRELGRYVIANEEIRGGETLVVEDAAVACLFPEKFGTHCHHCFERFLAPVGCPDCASVAFCGPVCREEASRYHKYECKFLDLLIGSGMSVLSLAALRSVTQRSLEECLEVCRKKEPREGLFGLCTNGSKRKGGDFLQRTLMAAFLLRCLQKAGFFRSGEAVVPTEEEYEVGEMLLHHLQVLQFNAHEIYETLYTEEHRLKGGRPAYIGVGVYPTVSLFNHECYPAVTRYFAGKHIVITSLRPLLPGAPISENYGPVFTHGKLINRQRALSSRYWFNCQCNACFEDWPTLNDGSLTKHVRCPTPNCAQLFTLPPTDKEVQCPKCEKKISLNENIEKLKWCEGQYEKGAKLVDCNEKEKAMEVLLEGINVFHRVSAPPHKETHLAEDALRACLGDFGNTCDCLVKTT